MKTQFESDLSALLNRNSRERASNTPDFVLARYMLNCLEAFEEATQARDKWYGISPSPATGTADRWGSPATVAELLAGDGSYSTAAEQ